MNTHEINNLSIANLWHVFKEETLPESSWNLILDAKDRCRLLHSKGVRCSTDLFELVKYERELHRIVSETGIGREYILSLYRRLKFNRFKPVTLSKLEDAEKVHIAILKKEGITDTGKLLLIGCTKGKRSSLSKKTNIPLRDIEKLVCIADLMRLPGTKTVKVRLLMSNGIKTLKILGQQDPDTYRLRCKKVIERTGIAKAVPTPKEVISDIEWARLFPSVVDV